MAQTTDSPLYSPRSLHGFTESVFRAVGVPEDDARITAENLIEADLRGVESHGISRLLLPYVRRIQKGLMRPVTELTVVRERPGTALLDGGNGLGQVVAHRAMDMAIAKAEATGAGWVAVRNSNHFGAAGYFALRAAARDMIGIIGTNGPAAVAPFGGRAPMLSTNPLAFAVPAGQEPPVLLDMATTVVSRGRILLYAKKGLDIPPTWALDEAGQPTTSAREALKGTLQPMAGYKGYGLSLIVDLLSGVLTGATYGMHCQGFLLDYTRPPADLGSFFAAVSVDSFMDVPEFRARVDQALREIKSSPRAPGVERIYAPGEIEHERRAVSLDRGITVPAEVLPELSALGEELGVVFPQPL